MNNHNRINSVHYHAGVTLLELMISTLILGIIISVAMPSFSGMGDTQRLIGATEQIYNHIQQTRSESVSKNSAAYIKFEVDGTASWEYGFSTVSGTCSLTVTVPTTANACVIVVDDGDGLVDPGDGSVDNEDLVLMRFIDTEWRDVKLNINSFSSGNTQIDFNPVRGTSTSGQINVESGNGKQLNINVSLLGRPTICIPSTSTATAIGGYTEC